MNIKTDKRIFLVDDDPYWTSILTQILENLGYTNIISFSNGEDCVKNLHLNPSIVFLDYKMNDMDGIEVLKRIKSYFPNIGVIFCTAYEDLSIAVEAIEYGSYDYLLKGNANIKEVSTIINGVDESVSINYA